MNHQNFSKMTHPHPKRNFVPTIVATKSGKVLVNAAKQNSAASTSTARPKVNSAAIRPNMNAKSSYFKPHFLKRRNFNQRSAAKTNTFSRKINTAKRKNDQGIFDSGCSRHMTGNKSFFIEYQEIDDGFVAFRGSPKGGKITGNQEKSLAITSTTSRCSPIAPLISCTSSSVIDILCGINLAARGS
nr:hypothetical protein [Tanacetum cinerariifolium]